MDSIFLRQRHHGKQWRKPLLIAGSIIALLLALVGTMSPFQGVSAAPRLQSSPLSPLIPATETISITTAAVTTTTLITSTIEPASEPLSAAVISEPVASVEMTSPLTVTAESEAPGGIRPRMDRPISLLWALPTSIAGGQVSLILVAALFVGLFTVIGLVLTRR